MNQVSDLYSLQLERSPVMAVMHRRWGPTVFSHCINNKRFALQLTHAYTNTLDETLTR